MNLKFAFLDSVIFFQAKNSNYNCFSCFMYNYLFIYVIISIFIDKFNTVVHFVKKVFIGYIK